ncbi:hypothetical protein GCM10020219_051370 [Nonomuraea dietziae]
MEGAPKADTGPPKASFADIGPVAGPPKTVRVRAAAAHVRAQKTIPCSPLERACWTCWSVQLVGRGAAGPARLLSATGA